MTCRNDTWDCHAGMTCVTLLHVIPAYHSHIPFPCHFCMSLCMSYLHVITACHYCISLLVGGGGSERGDMSFLQVISACHTCMSFTVSHYCNSLLCHYSMSFWHVIPTWHSCISFLHSIPMLFLHVITVSPYCTSFLQRENVRHVIPAGH